MTSMQTALDKARAFFDRNPDEVLTREDIRVKFGCGVRTSHNVAKALMREGVARSQLPVGPVRPRPRPRASAAFPNNLAPAERRSIEAFIAHGSTRGSVRAAAQAQRLSYHTVSTQLRDARRKAGVATTAELAVLYTREARQAQASTTGI